MPDFWPKAVYKIYNYRYSYFKKIYIFISMISIAISILNERKLHQDTKFNDFFAITLHTNRESTLLAR